MSRSRWTLLSVVLLGALSQAGCESLTRVGPVDQTPTLQPMRTSAAVGAAGGRAVGGGARAFGGPTLGEEVWIIAKADRSSEADAATPGIGCMLAPQPDGRKIAVPLKHTDVRASISAYIATVDVTQQFHNPFDEKIEAEYVFPLPANAAVNEFVMTIGDRRIRGIVRERAEAERIYRRARDQGHVATLLTQERPNIFTQKVANIEPGKQIDVNIKYLHTLRYDDGWYEWVFPMVVGPRFNPAGSTDGIGAVARGARVRSGRRTEIEYLAPGDDTDHRVSLRVDVDAGVMIEDVVSVNHRTKMLQVGSPMATMGETKYGTSFSMSIDPSDDLPNKDFVLRWKVAGDRIKASLLTETTRRGNYFTLMLVPPAEPGDLARRPMEMVFVLDCSASMSGVPLSQSKAAIDRALDRLGPDDTFQIIRFSSNASQFGSAPVPVNRRSVREARTYVRGLSGSGGTHMLAGLAAALEFPHDSRRLRTVTFLTDGYIGNDREIIGEVAQRIGAARVFSFGVGSSPNRYLMDRMAKVGRGAVAYLSNTAEGGEVMDAFFDRVAHPALTDLRIDFGGARVDAVYPQKLADLFVGRPVVIAGRYDGSLPSQVVVDGFAGDRRVKIIVPTRQPQQANRGIETVWARAKIADLYDRHTIDPSDHLVRQVRQTALDYGLMSAYTAFVAVDSARRTRGDHGVTVRQPVPVPDGARHDTTVEQSRGSW